MARRGEGGVSKSRPPDYLYQSPHQQFPPQKSVLLCAMPHLIDLMAQPHSPESRLKVIEAELAKIDLLVKPTKKTHERRAILEAEALSLRGKRLAKVYAIPPNRYLRLIEFADGSRGQMECRPTSRLRPGWNVVVAPHPERVGVWSLVKEWP